MQLSLAKEKIVEKIHFETIFQFEILNVVKKNPMYFGYSLSLSKIFQLARVGKKLFQLAMMEDIWSLFCQLVYQWLLCFEFCGKKHIYWILWGPEDQRSYCWAVVLALGYRTLEEGVHPRRGDEEAKGVQELQVGRIG